MRLFFTRKQMTEMLEQENDSAMKAGIYRGYKQGFEEGRVVGYNEGKAEGIKVSKRAFALALKQKGDSNNDVLR